MNDELLKFRQELQQLIQRYNDLERRFASQQKGQSPQLPGTPEAPTPENPSFTKTKADMSSAAREFISVQPSSVSPANLFGLIGALCFFLGAAFLIKLSIDDGWLTPFRQYGLSQLLSVAFMVAGLVLHSKDHAYAGILAGTGVITGFMAAFAGHAYFDIFSQEVALVITILVSLASIWMREKFESDFFSVLAVVGTFISPFFLDFSRVDLIMNSVFYLLLTAAFAIIATKIKSRLTILVTGYFGLASYLVANGLQSVPLENVPTMSLVIFAQFAILLGAVVTYSITHKETLGKEEAAGYFPLLLFFYSLEYLLLNRWIPAYTPWIGLGFGCVVLAAYFVAKNQLDSDELESAPVAWGVFSATLFHSGYFNLLPDRFKPYIVVVVLLASLLFQRGDSSFSIPKPILFMFGAIFVLEIGSLLKELLFSNVPTFHSWLGLLIALLVTLSYKGQNTSTKKNFGHPILITTHVIVMLSAYRLVESYGSLAVSATWCAYSLIVLLGGIAIKDKIFAKSSILCLLISAGKALTFDVASQPSTVRILCLLLTGALLYGTGFAFRKIEALEDDSR